MAVSDVAGSTSYTAAKQNVCWSELDRKMTLLMDGKSWFMLSHSGAAADRYLRQIVGKRFFFSDKTYGRVSSWISAWGGSLYDHSVFTDAVAASTEAVVPMHGLDNPEHTQKITLRDVPDVNLDDSLEAHTFEVLNEEAELEAYYVWPNSNIMPEKKYRFAVAELIFEHDDTPTHYVPKEWNKYQYFRIHNLNGYSIAVHFEADDGSVDIVTVPRWECRCVQRLPGGHIQLGYNYFWQALGTDPRVLALPQPAPWPAAIYQTPYQSTYANNAVNFSLGFHVIALFSQARATDGLGLFGNVRWIRYTREVFNIYPLNADYFGNPANGGTILGDILHHKGTITYLSKDAAGSLVRTVGLFSGYGNLPSMAASTGLSVVSDSLGVTIQGLTGDEYNDVVCTGTNLLYSDIGEIEVIADVTAPVSIAFQLPTVVNSPTEGFYPVIAEDQTISYSHDVYTLDSGDNLVFDSTTTVSYTEPRIVNVAPDAATTLKPHQDTIATALEFNTFGLTSLVGTNQNSSVCTLRNREIILTAWGPVITWEQVYTLEGSINRGPVGFGEVGRPFHRIAGTHLGPYNYLEGEQIVERRFIQWGGYGWQEMPRIDEATGEYNGAHGGFIGPRRKRQVLAKIPMQDVLSNDAHPNIETPIWNENGTDFEILLPSRIVSNGIQTLYTPDIVDGPEPGHWPLWSCDDWLYEYETLAGDESGYLAQRTNMFSPPDSAYMPRVTLLVEHYNTLAAWINSITKARPYSWRDVPWYLEATTESGNGATPTGLVWDAQMLSVGGFPYVGGTVGILGSTIRPRTQYAGFSEDSFLYRLFDELGVTIKTDADFPTPWEDVTTTLENLWGIAGKWRRVVREVNLISTGPDVWEIVWRSELVENDTPTEFINTLGNWQLSALNSNSVMDCGNPDPVAHDSDIMSATYLQVDTSDYRWVTIDDVQACAESLGFKFIFEELSVPIELVNYELTAPELMIDHNSEHSFTESPTTSWTVGDELTVQREFGRGTGDDALLNYTNKLSKKSETRFVTDPEGSWKRDVPDPTVADTVAGDIGVHVGPTDFTSQANFIYKRGLPVALQNHERLLRYNAIDYQKAMQFSCYVSTGITVNNTALLLPTPWFTHATDDFSEQSELNARMRVLFFNSTLPAITAGAYAAAVSESLTVGDSLIEPETGEAAEVLIYLNTFVNCI